MSQTRQHASGRRDAGKLRIGDDWNAITIIALSQSNPLKAVAEFVENSIDAKARHVTITRGREHGAHYLRIADDGTGVPRDEHGVPDFKYVATHICDSIKRRLKHEGMAGLQGEFGIGLLSFWTVGEELLMTCAGADGHTYHMTLRKSDPGYSVRARRALFAPAGTEIYIRPLLPGIRHFSGEKIQWYLASELRDRIRQSGVKIKIVDRAARREYRVEPRRFAGRLLHQLPAVIAAAGEVYLELYLTEPAPDNRVGLYRAGTRVLEDIAQLEALQHAPWTSGYLQGIVDAPFLNLTPGTRTGIIQDEAYAALCAALAPVEQALAREIEAQRQAEEEHASEHMLRTIQKAFKEALLALPAEEYDWFDVAGRGGNRTARGSEPALTTTETHEMQNGAAGEARQKQFFEFAGPLYSARIVPTSCLVPVGQARTLRALARDRTRHRVEQDLRFRWEIVEGGGHLENSDGEIVTFQAPAEPALVRLAVEVTQAAVTCAAEAAITVTDSLLPEPPEDKRPTMPGLPGYTFQRAPGELWRSRFDAAQNVIVVNNAHRDFVYAARSKTLKLRYISRLYAKEMVYKNFPGQAADQLLERMIELSLYTEENLK